MIRSKGGASKGNALGRAQGLDAGSAAAPPGPTDLTVGAIPCANAEEDIIRIVAVAANRRLLTAKQLISDTAMPLAQVAHAAGYQSLRRFNDAIRTAYGVAPTEIRRASENRAGSTIRLRLGYRPPFDFSRILAYLKGRAIPGVEAIGENSYARSFSLSGASGVVTVTPAAGANDHTFGGTKG